MFKKYKNRYKDKSKIAELVAKLLWDKYFIGGMVIPHLRYWANKDIRKNFFNPLACAHISDMSGGRINGSTFTLLREVYTQGAMSPNCPLPSVSIVNRTKYKRIAWAIKNNIALVDTCTSSTGKGVRFRDIPQVVYLIFKAYRLDSIARV